LSVALGILSCMFNNVGATPRTAVGLLVAAAIGFIGDRMSRHPGKHWTNNWWMANNLMIAGYGLAYFFVFATYYVVGLNGFDTPYTCWALGLALGGVGAWHGTVNDSHFTRRLTALVTFLFTG